MVKRIAADDPGINSRFQTKAVKSHCIALAYRTFVYQRSIGREQILCTQIIFHIADQLFVYGQHFVMFGNITVS